MKEFKTSKGTILQVSDIKGQDYMRVHQRLVWFREEHPDWTIETAPTEYDTPDSATFKTTIKDEKGRVIATAHKTETKQGFADYLEKAETGSVGRALLFCGYGTAFCSYELNEEERIVDTPVEPKKLTGVVHSRFEPDIPSDLTQMVYPWNKPVHLAGRKVTMLYDDQITHGIWYYGENPPKSTTGRKWLEALKLEAGKRKLNTDTKDLSN